MAGMSEQVKRLRRLRGVASSQNHHIGRWLYVGPRHRIAYCCKCHGSIYAAPDIPASTIWANPCDDGAALGDYKEEEVE